jgi:hypothetical protein
MNKLTHPAACMRVLFYVVIAIHDIRYRIAGFRHNPHHRGRPPARKQVAQLRYDLIIGASKRHQEPHCIPRKPRPLPL